jgi:hypothetical protein
MLQAHKNLSYKEMTHTQKTNMFVVVVGLAFVYGLFMMREGFIQKDAGMPLTGPAMGPYDTSMGGWMSSEHMPVGNTPQNKALEGNKLMYLVGNTVDPKCCPSAFTTDSGCVCLSSSDESLMATRGGNK